MGERWEELGGSVLPVCVFVCMYEGNLLVRLLEQCGSGGCPENVLACVVLLFHGKNMVQLQTVDFQVTVDMHEFVTRCGRGKGRVPRGRYITQVGVVV